MGLTINRPGIGLYGNNLLKNMEETGRSEFGHAQGNGKALAKGRDEPSVRLSISNEALAMQENGEAIPPGMEQLSEEDRKRMQELTGELDEIVGGAGGFRKLTETQWERVEGIFGEISDIHNMPEEQRPRIDDLKRVYELENELDEIQGDDPGKVLSTEEQERVDEIMQELGGLWGSEDEVVLSEEEEKQLDALEKQLESLNGKLDSWSLSREDEEKVDSIFSAMDRIYEQAEKRMYEGFEYRRAEAV